jgi:hypothetical protein
MGAEERIVWEDDEPEEEEEVVELPVIMMGKRCRKCLNKKHKRMPGENPTYICQQCGKRYTEEEFNRL